jgi:hypothetical protein
MQTMASIDAKLGCRFASSKLGSSNGVVKRAQKLSSKGASTPLAMNFLRRKDTTSNCAICLPDLEILSTTALKMQIAERSGGKVEAYAARVILANDQITEEKVTGVVPGDPSCAARAAHPGVSCAEHDVAG